MNTAFDFDGTLTDKDTLLGFFLAGTVKHRNVKLLLYFVCACLTKTRFLSNTRLKEVGVYLFLKGKSKAEIEQQSKLYAKSIKLNQVFFNDYCSTENAKVVISASFYEYLKYIFDPEKVIASSLRYSGKGEVEGVAFNCYHEAKRTAMYQRGINHIDLFYTDNLQADGPIVRMSGSVMLVKKGGITSKIQVNENTYF
ncbi:HAD family hydrolase [Chitinophaga flava]|uniref:Haloacid dehalogenase-like hydrolase n=1 Tax=Chitinophaga flava TaxID=2259036 RepID=A0A365Y5N6_9BACT|nr:HAD family hydrolase [Chitinophaga flava]RBL93810.1 hypothetical protein DF182_15045 [Chitinophaga flava]